MNELFAAFLGATMMTVLLGSINHFNPYSHKNIVETAKTECEKSLPRDQKCKIIAVPEERK